MGFRLVEGTELALTEECMPPGAREQRHRHREARQIFYVLSGSLEIEVEGQVSRLASGDALFVAPGRAHSVHNASSADASFLVIAAPSTANDRENLP